MVLLVFAIAILALSHDYSESARRMPRLVAGTLTVLALLDLYGRSSLPGHRQLNSFMGSGFEHREMRYRPPLGKELVVLGWVLAAFAAIALIGILIALPLFCLSYVLLQARRPVFEAVLVASIVLIFQFVVFELVLDYELYRGLLFSKGGLSQW
nr:tripartite tricarboxylate transporter TctB family protein [Actibacterium sp. MT2.3-13A]